MEETPIMIKIHTLGEPMDSYMKKLFSLFFLNLQKPYSEFFKECHDELRESIHAYLDGHSEKQPNHDYLFNNLTIIWKTYQNNGRLGEAQEFWQDILNIIVEWEQSRNDRIHKGSIFFFWSQTAILQGQLDKGFFLIHSSYEEDVVTHKNELPSTPAFKTVSLDYSDRDNYLYELVEAWAIYLDNLIIQYQRLSGRAFSKDCFQIKFLCAPPSRDTLYSFTYVLARFFYFDQIPPILVNGNFASAFELNLFFDLILIIDDVIYSNFNTPKKDDWGFKNHANHLLVKSGLATNFTINAGHLEEINSGRKVDFNKTIHELLDQRFVYLSDRISPSRLECDIGIVFCMRNFSAHKIGSFPVVRERFVEIRQSIFNILFLAVQIFS